MKTLITGSEGFVGREFCRVLQDHDITRIDIKDGGQDARDFFRISDQRFDLVVHLAAVVGGRQTIEGNPLSVAVDLSIDAEMFQWAMRTRPEQIVYYSSSAAYPIELQTWETPYILRESDINLLNIKNPDLTYGWSKLTGEYLAQFAQADGLKVYVFRPFSGYGEFQDLSYPFPSFVQRGIRRDDPFEIWGDGTQVRDFIHIEDVVGATLAAVNADIDGPVNLSTGLPTSFNDLARIVCRTAGYDPQYKHILDAPTGVEYRVGDARKMLTFYTPKIDLYEGVQRSFKHWTRS